MLRNCLTIRHGPPALHLRPEVHRDLTFGVLRWVTFGELRWGAFGGLRWDALAALALLLPLAGCRTASHVQQDAAYCEPVHDDRFSATASDPSRNNDVALAAYEPSAHEPSEDLPFPAEEIIADPELLTLSEIENIALQNNPTLAAVAARIEAAQGRQVQAGLYPNPVVGYHATEVGNVGTAGAQGAFVSQRFITGGKLQLDQAIASQELEATHFQSQAQQQRVLSDVRARFYETLVAQRRVELTRELAAIGDEIVTATKKLLEGRLGTENDLLQAEIRADEAHILLDDARNLHAEARRRLAAVLGVPTMPAKGLAGQLDSDLPSLDWDSCHASVLSGHPELNAAWAHVERTSLAVARAHKEPIPNIDVSVSLRHHNRTGDDVVNVQAGIPIPIFNKNQGNIQAAHAEWLAANQEVQRIELALRDRLAVTYRRYANARQRVDRYGQRIVPKAEKSLKIVTDGYEKGQVKYLTLLTAQKTYHQVNLSYLDSLRELWAATTVIEGQLLSESLVKQR